MGVKRLAVEYWAPIVLWLAVIFIFSSDAFSAGHTSGIIVPILRFLFPWLSPEGLEFSHAFIRKTGHVTEYFILAVFTYRSFRQERIDLTHAKLMTFSFVAVAAIVDEFHQRLTLFRTGSPIDVGYDCLGAVLALWFFTIYETWRLRTYPVL